MGYGFDMAPERTLAITLSCSWKGTEKLGKVFFYIPKKSDGWAMVIPEAHMAYVCRKAQPLGPVVWEIKGRVERYWAEHGRMPTAAEAMAA